MTITNDRLRLLIARANAHEDAGEEEVRIGAAELRELALELTQRRGHECPTEEDLARHRARENRWGYDG